MLLSITPLFNEVSNLPAAMQFILLSAVGTLGVWLTKKHIHKHAESY
jgi:hypothetical protein